LRQFTNDTTESFASESSVKISERLQSATNIQIDIFDRFIRRFEQVNVALWENRDQVFEGREIGDESTFAASVEERGHSMVTTYKIKEIE
jgi:hypothetical protein